VELLFKGKDLLFDLFALSNIMDNNHGITGGLFLFLIHLGRGRKDLKMEMAFDHTVLDFTFGRSMIVQFLFCQRPEGFQITGGIRAVGVKKLVDISSFYAENLFEVPPLDGSIGAEDSPLIINQADELGKGVHGGLPFSLCPANHLEALLKGRV
jgi:hypothetical protein